MPVLVLLLAACQAPPTVPPLPPVPAAPAAAVAQPSSGATRAEALQRLGFEQTEEGWEFSMQGKLLFDTSSDALDPESLATARRIGAGLARIGVAHLRVEGHTDSLGSAVFNQALSLRRAHAVAGALASQGLPLAGMLVRGLGEARPVSGNATAAGRLQNRRVAIIVQTEP